MRAQLINKVQILVEESNSAPPVVELDDFFTGNNQEDCIAPNQVGEGRPSLAELYASLKSIRDRSDVQTVLVGIHDDWVEAVEYDESGLRLRTCTSTPQLSNQRSRNGSLVTQRMALLKDGPMASTHLHQSPLKALRCTQYVGTDLYAFNAST